MGSNRTEPDSGTKSLRAIALWVLIAVASFYGAYSSAKTGFLILIYPFALLHLADAESSRKAFYSGFAVGLLIAATRLEFFWQIFSAAAIALWAIFGFWIGFFTMVTRLCLRRFGLKWGWWLVPFLWTGLEYFRSELYYLRFGWLTPGYAFANLSWLGPVKYLGVYGIGFVLAVAACASAFLWQRSKLRSLALLALGGLLLGLWSFARPSYTAASFVAGVKVAGVQLEFPSDRDVVHALDQLARDHPEAELAVLSEYTFQGPVPKDVTEWCRLNKRYLVVGGTDPAPKGNFYDTAFVVGPSGEVIFRQVKSVPVQFFKDGLPAPKQNLWASPWGKIGLCVCYDLSYSRVTDRLVKLGAEAMIVPTMDAMDWGQREHELHARVAPIRAAEYGIPILRVASSGISQLVDCRGHVVQKAPFLGESTGLAGQLRTGARGSLPVDRWLAPVAVALTGIFITWSCLTAGLASIAQRRQPGRGATAREPSSVPAI